MGYKQSQDYIIRKKDTNYFGMEWQTISVSIISVAWSNNYFKSELLKNTNKLLHELINGCPPDIKFCGLENSQSVNHLILPYRDFKTFGWSKEKFSNFFHENEASDTLDLNYGLPKKLIVDCFYDLSLKEELLRNPKKLLKSLCYDVDDNVTYYTHENTELISHIILPYNKWHGKGLSSERLEQLLLDDLKKPSCN
ncbi:MAG: hypothetical protein AAF195_04835, partial [Pseudomonadota bacterium]